MDQQRWLQSDTELTEKESSPHSGQSRHWCSSTSSWWNHGAKRSNPWTHGLNSFGWTYSFEISQFHFVCSWSRTSGTPSRRINLSCLYHRCLALLCWGLCGRLTSSSQLFGSFSPCCHRGWNECLLLACGRFLSCQACFKSSTLLSLKCFVLWGLRLRH